MTDRKRAAPKARGTTDPEVKEGLTRIRERNHLKDNMDAIREAIDAAVARAMTNLTPPPPPSTPLPRWAMATMLVGGGLVTLCTLAGIGFAMVQSYASAQVQGQEVQSRIATLEAWRTETVAAGLPAKLAQFETTFAIATRNRDTQQQAVTDRLRGLELSDQAGSQQINALAQNLAGLVARMEEMLRRQERLENRLSLPMPRQGAEEAPAVATSPPAPHI